MRNLKKFLAVLVVVAMMATSMVTAFGAADPAMTPADKAAGLGLLKGGNDGVTEEYLNTTTQRIQTARIYLRLLGKEAEAEAYTATTDNFADADKVKDAPGAVNLLAYLRANPQLGWVGDGTNFNPLGEVSGQALYKVMLTCVGYTQGLDFDYADTIGFARAKGFSLAAYVGYADSVTNNGMAAAMIEALGTTLNGKTITLAADLVAKNVITADAADKYTSYAKPVATATPTPGPLAISSIKSDNLIQLNVAFNNAIDGTKGADKANYTVKVGNTPKTVKYVSLSADKKTATILLDGVDNQIKQAEAVTVTYKKDAAGTTADVTATSAAINDTTIPTIKGVAVVGNKLVKVTFSEPIIDTEAKNLGNYKIDGSVLPAMAPVLSDDGLVVTLKLSTALTAGVHKVVVGGKDYATFPVVTNSTDITVATDTKAPATVTLVGDATQAKVVVKFDKEIDSVESAKVGSLATDGIPAVDGTDATKVTLNYASPYLPAAPSTIIFTNVKDLYGNVTPSMTLAVTPVLDNVRPEFKAMTQPVTGSNTAFVIEYSKDVDYNSGTYLLKDKDGNVVSVGKATYTESGATSPNKKKVRLNASEAIDGSGKEGPWTLKITDVKDASPLANVIVENTQTLNFADKTVPAAPSVSFSGLKIFIVFNEKMDVATALTATNYSLVKDTGAVTSLPSDAIIALSADGKIVTITMPSGTTMTTAAASINIFGVKDFAGNAMVGVTKPVAAGTTSAPTVSAAYLKDGHTVVLTVGSNTNKLNSNSVVPYDFKVYNGTTILTTTAASYDSADNVNTVTLTIQEEIKANATYDGASLRVYTADENNTTDLYGTKVAPIKLSTAVTIPGVPVTDKAKATASAIAKAYFDGTSVTTIRVTIDENLKYVGNNSTALGQFTVNVNGSLRNFSVVASGTELIFTLVGTSADVNKTATVTFVPQYNAGTLVENSDVMDASGNALKAFTLAKAIE